MTIVFKMLSNLKHPECPVTEVIRQIIDYPLTR